VRGLIDDVLGPLHPTCFGYSPSYSTNPDPKIPLDTNGVERALRGVVVGRKNHYGSRSERGTHVAALFYSLIESAKLCHVEPRAYLKEATLRAVRNPGTVTLARDLKSPEA